MDDLTLFDTIDFITDFAHEASEFTDAKLLYDRCCTLPNLIPFRAELWAAHFTCYDDFSTPVQLSGKILCKSMLTFILCAHTEVPLDDPRRLSDFRSLKVHKDFIHEGDSPISRMSLQVVTDLIWGFEWLVLSELFEVKRTPEFIKEAQQLYRLLRNRIFFFIASESLSNTVLDVVLYTIEEKKGLFAKVDTSDVDYASDDEIYKTRKQRLDADLSKHDLTTMYVNSNFIYDMDSVFSHFERHWHFYHKTQDLIQTTPQPQLSKFRKWLFEQTETLEVRETLKARREWQESLQITPAIERVFKRVYGISQKPKPRQMIVVKHVSFVEVGACTSYLEITTRSKGKNHEIMLRLATDSMFQVWCIQMGLTMDLSKVIFRDRIRNVWLVKIDEYYIEASSYTHGFRILRMHMNETKYIRKIDVSIFDAMF